MVRRCNTIEPERLPPTAHYHSLHVPIQVARWDMLNNTMPGCFSMGLHVRKIYHHSTIIDFKGASPQMFSSSNAKPET